MPSAPSGNRSASERTTHDVENKRKIAIAYGRHHDTIVHLLNGNEYIVVETPEEIVERVTYLRAKAIALAARLATDGLAELGGTASAGAVQPLPTVVTDEEA